MLDFYFCGEIGPRVVEIKPVTGRSCRRQENVVNGAVSLTGGGVTVEIESNGVVKDGTEISLEVISFADYRAPLSKIQPNSKQRHQIEKGLSCYCVGGMFYEITKLKTTLQESPLKLDSDGLPVTDKELKVLRASEKENYSWKDERPAESRQAIIKSLADRGLIEVKPKSKKSGSVLKDRNICGMITAPKALNQSSA